MRYRVTYLVRDAGAIGKGRWLTSEIEADNKAEALERFRAINGPSLEYLWPSEVKTIEEDKQ